MKTLWFINPVTDMIFFVAWMTYIYVWQRFEITIKFINIKNSLTSIVCFVHRVLSCHKSLADFGRDILRALYFQVDLEHLSKKDYELTIRDSHTVDLSHI